jgi:hypothetical protein
MRQSLILFDKGASSARDTLLTKRNCLWSRAFGRDVTGDPTYFHAAVAAADYSFRLAKEIATPVGLVWRNPLSPGDVSQADPNE